MNSTKIKKTIIKLLPYIILGLVCTNLGEAWRLSEGSDMGKKMLSFFSMVGVAFGNRRRCAGSREDAAKSEYGSAFPHGGVGGRGAGDRLFG